MPNAEESAIGGLDSTVSSADANVELRKSCDYCVRLKRACDGKKPCSLCARRRKECTRSARKKSGPAKGTKYAPRRKRSAIAEWADRASVDARGVALQSHISSGLVGTGVGGGAPTFDRFPISSPPRGAAPGSTAAFLASRVAPGERREAGAWGDSSVVFGSRGRQRVEADSRTLSSSSTAPFLMERLIKMERGDVPGGRPTSYLEKPGMSLESATAEALSRRQQPVLPVAWSAPPIDETARSRLSRMEAFAATSPSALAGGGNTVPTAPAVLESRGGGERHPTTVAVGSPVPSLPRSFGVEPQQGRVWEPPPREWANQPGVYDGSAHGKRFRLSSQSSSTDKNVSLAQALDASPQIGQSEKHTGDRSPKRPRGSDPALSAQFHPNPREPPDPTAGFTFRPAAQLLSWRRPSSYSAPWGARGEDSGVPNRGPPPPPHSYHERSPSWSSAGGDRCGVGGSDDLTQGRVLREAFREEAGELRAGLQKAGEEWRVQKIEAETLQRRSDLPPPKYEEGRHWQPAERLVVGGNAQVERDSQGRTVGMLQSLPPSEGAPDGGRQEASAHVAGVELYKQQLERSAERFAASASFGKVDERPGQGNQNIRGWEGQHRPGSEWQGAPSGFKSWEDYSSGARFRSAQLEPSPDVSASVSAGGGVKSEGVPAMGHISKWAHGSVGGVDSGSHDNAMFRGPAQPGEVGGGDRFAKDKYPSRGPVSAIDSIGGGKSAGSATRPVSEGGERQGVNRFTYPQPNNTSRSGLSLERGEMRSFAPTLARVEDEERKGGGWEEEGHGSAQPCSRAPVSGDDGWS